MIRKSMSEVERQERLEEFGQTIAEKRDDAIAARKASGIEDVWLACEEAYLGIDDANRGEFEKAKWAKPTTMDGAVTTGRIATGQEVKSTAFVRLTSRYVDAGAAKLSEILLPIDDKPFSFTATPVPDLANALKDDSPAIVGGQPVMRAPDPIQAQPGAAPGQAPAAVPVTVKDIAQQDLDRANDCAKKAETRIYDWMVECNYPAEMRKVLQDASRLGVGVLKGPFPDISTSKAVSKMNGGIELVITETIKPVVRWIDPWNLFPAESAGEDIHHGEYILERDFLSSRMLKKLKGQPGYINSQIDKVLKEGPDKCEVEGGSKPGDKKNKSRFSVWYFYGSIKREDMALAKAVGIDLLPEDQDEVYAIITLVNDSVIRATINPLGSGEFPYHAFPWSRRAGHWAGVGPGEQVAMPQRMVNAATRALLNNAGKSAGAQIVIDQASITPADKNWTITPDKIWYKTAESTIDDVRKAFMSVVFPNLGQQLMSIIDYAFKLAEEATNIPLISQGQTGPTTPDTFGATELQNNNANTLLRSVGYAVDDYITEPVVNAFYEYLLLDPAVPDDEKGDVKINAHGSIAMIEKAIQEQTMMQMGALVGNPIYGADPKKWFAEMLRSKRLDPRVIQYTEEEMKQLQSQQPPPPPQVQAAQIRAQSALQVQQAKDQAELQRVAQESAHEQQLLQNGGTTPHMASATARIEQERIRAVTAERVEASRAHAEIVRADKEMLIAQQNGQFDIQKLQLEKELALLQYAHENKMSLDQLKTELAKSAMDNQTKKELAAAEIQLAANEGHQNRLVDAHKHAASLVRDEISTPNTP